MQTIKQMITILDPAVIQSILTITFSVVYVGYFGIQPAEELKYLGVINLIRLLVS